MCDCTICTYNVNNVHIKYLLHRQKWHRLQQLSEQVWRKTVTGCIADDELIVQRADWQAGNASK
jgi:hypothetical protein